MLRQPQALYYLKLFIIALEPGDCAIRHGIREQARSYRMVSQC
jgi:hypothetical protein